MDVPKRNVSQAISWYEAAFAHGMYTAINRLIPLYVFGDGELKLSPKKVLGVYRSGKPPVVPPDYVKAYTLGRILNLSTNKPGADSVGSELMSCVQPGLSVAQQTQAEQAADKLFAPFRAEYAANTPAASAGKGFSETPAAGAMTKEQWKQRLAQKCPWRPGANLAVAKTEFVQAMGQPPATQKIGSSVYWTYACTDGNITVIVRDDMLNTAGMMIGRIDED